MPCSRHEPISIPGCNSCRSAARSKQNRKDLAWRIAQENQKAREKAEFDQRPSEFKRLWDEGTARQAAEKARKKQEKAMRAEQQAREKAREQAEREAFYKTPEGQRYLAEQKLQREEKARQEAAANAARRAKQQTFRDEYVRGLGERRKATDSEANRAGVEAAILTFILLMVALFGGLQMLHWWVGVAALIGVAMIARRHILGGEEHGKETRVYEVVAKALIIPVVLLGGLTIPFSWTSDWFRTLLVFGSIVFCGYAFVAGRKAYRRFPLKVRSGSESPRVLFPWT